MKKINLKLRLNNRIQLKNILEYFENVAFYKRKNYWDIDIFFFSKIEEIIAKKYLRNTKYLNFKTIEEKNWIKANIQEDKVNSTELFSFSQGLKKLTKKKKHHLYLPASEAFGTGSHVSTLLVVQNIEYLLKIIKLNSYLDLGTGTGILSFVIKKLTKKKIFSSDNDQKVENIFKKNMKINNLSGFIFVRCKNFNNKILRDQKYGLIVANILYNPLRKLSRDFYLRLNKSGYLVLSGILVGQTYSIVSFYRKFNFRVIKVNKLSGWVSIIFKKV